MAKRVRLFRFLAGFAGVIILLAILFSLLPGLLHTWGATPQEIAMEYPGDELISQPQVEWTHGITIHAPVEDVWPWIAQIGDVRGGYYSYTFIENAIARDDTYHNADRILPEYQNPEPGTGIIADMLKIHEVNAPQWMLASVDEGLGWTWLWYLSPLEDGNTRLVVHMNIRAPDEFSNPLLMGVIDVSGFVMERNMMTGIKQRAEGSMEPAYIEALEIGIWLAALMVGLVSAWMFLRDEKWLPPLLLGLASILGLFVLTFAQPGIWLRLLLDVVLLLLLVLLLRNRK